MFNAKSFLVNFIATVFIVLGFNYGVNMMADAGEGSQYMFGIGMFLLTVLPLLGVGIIFRKKAK